MLTCLLCWQDEANNQSSAVPASNVNKAIQGLAQKYCGECKSAFDELSKIIQVGSDSKVGSELNKIIRVGSGSH